MPSSRSVTNTSRRSRASRCRSASGCSRSVASSRRAIARSRPGVVACACGSSAASNAARASGVVRGAPISAITATWPRLIVAAPQRVQGRGPSFDGVHRLRHLGLDGAVAAPLEQGELGGEVADRDAGVELRLDRLIDRELAEAGEQVRAHRQHRRDRRIDPDHRPHGRRAHALRCPHDRSDGRLGTLLEVGRGRDVPGPRATQPQRTLERRRVQRHRQHRAGCLAGGCCLPRHGRTLPRATDTHPASWTTSDGDRGERSAVASGAGSGEEVERATGIEPA